MKSYCDIKNQDAPMVECFFAFSTSQYNEGIIEKNLQDKEVLSAPASLFGTKEGIQAFNDFYKNRKQQIAQECDPQEVYNYEFGNYECDYVGDDAEAIERVVYYFGKERAKTVVRQWAQTLIE